MNAIEAAPDTAAWHAARRGHLTASRMRDVLAVGAKGQPLKAREDYMMELVAERMTGLAAQHFVTDAMQHGLDNEAGAIEAYETESGNLCSIAGFVLHPRIEFCGASPDRFVDEDGLVEAKCPSTTTFIRWMRAGVVPDEHKPQMLLQLACTGRKWCDFVAFDPRISMGRNVFIRRFEPSADEIAAVEKEAEKFLAEVQTLFDSVTGA